MSRAPALVVLAVVVSIAASGQATARSSPAESMTSAAAPLVGGTLVATARDLGTLGGQTSVATALDGTVVVGVADTAAGDAHAFAYDLAAPTPQMVDLGTLGGRFSYASAVEGKVVVGSARTPDDRDHAFVYDLGAAAPKMVDLGTLGGAASFGYAIDGGVVIGTSNTAAGRFRGFLYDLNAATPAMVGLGTLGGRTSWPHAMDEGIVVGRSDTASKTARAFAYDVGAAAPEMVDLGTLGGGNSEADAIDAGVVAGNSETATGRSHAFALDLGTAYPEMVDLGTLGGRYSSPNAIHQRIVVGVAQTSNDRERAFAYDLNAATPRMVDLGTLGGRESIASAIDEGVVVGDSYTVAGVHAFAYDVNAATPRMVDLGVLGVLGGSEGRAVAVQGNLAVGGVNSGPAGRRHAVVWTLSRSAAPVVQFGRVRYVVKENQGSATIRVRRFGDATLPLQVGYRAVPPIYARPAQPRKDFTPVHGTVVFAAGETSASFSVPILNDPVAEFAEGIALILSSPTGGGILGTPQVAELRIRASDQRPDAEIRTSAGHWVGNDVYNTTGAGQTVRRWGGRGQTTTFSIKVGSDPSREALNTYYTGRFTLRGSPPRPGFKIRYYWRGVDVTAAMLSPRGLRVTLGYYSKSIKARVTIRSGAALGTRQRAVVSAIWDNELRLIDRVRGIVTVAD